MIIDNSKACYCNKPLPRVMWRVRSGIFLAHNFETHLNLHLGVNGIDLPGKTWKTRWEREETMGYARIWSITSFTNPVVSSHTREAPSLSLLISGDSFSSSVDCGELIRLFDVVATQQQDQQLWSPRTSFIHQLSRPSLVYLSIYLFTHNRATHWLTNSTLRHSHSPLNRKNTIKRHSVPLAAVRAVRGISGHSYLSKDYSS